MYQTHITLSASMLAARFIHKPCIISGSVFRRAYFLFAGGKCYVSGLLGRLASSQDSRIIHLNPE
jgi:hypothetical protein